MSPGIITRDIHVTIQRSARQHPSLAPSYEVTVKVSPAPTAVVTHDFSRRIASPYEVMREVAQELYASFARGDVIHFLGNHYRDLRSAVHGIVDSHSSWE